MHVSLVIYVLLIQTLVQGLEIFNYSSNQTMKMRSFDTIVWETSSLFSLSNEHHNRTTTAEDVLIGTPLISLSGESNNFTNYDPCEYSTFKEGALDSVVEEWYLSKNLMDCTF